MFEQSGSGTLFLGGQKVSGSDIRDQNGMWTEADIATQIWKHS
jgi:T-complex protein 1 subunit alpha